MKDSVPEPEFVSVTVELACAGLTGTEPKLTPAGRLARGPPLELGTGATPVPVRETICGLLTVVSETRTAAEREPVPDGLNLTLTEQFFPGDNVEPHVVVIV